MQQSKPKPLVQTKLTPQNLRVDGPLTFSDGGHPSGPSPIPWTQCEWCKADLDEDICTECKLCNRGPVCTVCEICANCEGDNEDNQDEESEPEPEPLLLHPCGKLFEACIRLDYSGNWEAVCRYCGLPRFVPDPCVVCKDKGFTENGYLIHKACGHPVCIVHFVHRAVSEADVCAQCAPVVVTVLDADEDDDE